MADEPTPFTSIPHRIGTLRFDLQGTDEDRLMSLREEIAHGAESWLPEVLSEVLDEWAAPTDTVVLDRLEIDLGHIGHTGGFDRDRLRRILAQALADLNVPPAKPVTINNQVSHEVPELDVTKALVIFLTSGTLPWWSPEPRLAALFTRLAAQPDAVFSASIHLIRPHLRQVMAAERLVMQAPRELVLRLLQVMRATTSTSRADTSQSDLPPTLRARDPTNRTALIRVLCHAARSDLAPSAEMTTQTEGASADNVSQPDLNDVSNETLDTALDVACAGVVLVHPFLPQLFEILDLQHNGDFASPGAQETAVHLVAHLASGHDEHEEPDLALAKVLCGWALATPIARYGDLTSGIRDEATSLLSAVIDLWSALGATSPEGIRETFLQRPGRLRQSSDAWNLAVDPAAFDILLNQLPWGIGTVYLPWMDRPLMVDWS